jgi:adenosine deaminase
VSSALPSDFFKKIPKVELHVHLEGSVRPETVLKLSRRHGITLPADSVEGLQEWYRFKDFRHFVEIYLAITKCIRTPEDLELVAREFLEGQAAQNIKHSEVTYTASTVASYLNISWPDQHKALLSAMKYGEKELGVTAGIILDIVRGCSVEKAIEVAEWATTSEGVTALGLAGEEWRGTAQYEPAFQLAKSRGLPIIPHAGETVGPESVWETLKYTDPLRIGHGVRSIEDPRLVRELAARQIPLEVCPTSNVALGVYPSLAEHPLPKLLDEGVYVTLNSDDPPMFNTTLTDEFERCATTFDFNEDIVWTLCLNAARAAVLPDDRKNELIAQMRTEFSEAVGQLSVGA